MLWLRTDHCIGGQGRDIAPRNYPVRSLFSVFMADFLIRLRRGVAAPFPALSIKSASLSTMMEF